MNDWLVFFVFFLNYDIQMMVLFWRVNNKSNAVGEAPVFCHITIDGRRAEINTVQNKLRISELAYMVGFSDPN